MDLHESTHRQAKRHEEARGKGIKSRSLALDASPVVSPFCSCVCQRIRASSSSTVCVYIQCTCHIVSTSGLWEGLYTFIP